MGTARRVADQVRTSLIAGEADSDAASEGDGDGGCEHGVIASAANLAEDEDSPQRA